MSTIEIIENKISAARKYLKQTRVYESSTQEDIERDATLRGAVERYLYLTAQAVIDLAESVVAYKAFRKPTTMREAFHILQEENIIPADLAEEMAHMVGFRNVIAHDYGDIDYSIVSDVLHNKLSAAERFMDAIQNYIKI